MDITAGGKVESGAKANTSIFSTGNLATGVSVNHDDTEVKAIVHGDITAAGQISEEEEPTLIKSHKVNLNENTIAFDGLHGFKDGEFVTYLNESEGINTEDVGGLKDEETYVVHVEDDQTIKLSRGPAIDINANAANEGAIHSLSRQEVKALTPVDRTLTVGAVDTSRNTITLNNHGLETGNQVAYRIGENATAIEGLEADTSFHVIVVDDNTIQLAADPELLVVDSTDIEENWIQISDSGLTVGQEVVYRVGETAIGGLTDNGRYHVVEISGDKIKLAAETAEGTPIDLTGAGTGTHTFEKFTAIDLTGTGSGQQTIETYVDLRTLVNEQENTITLANHGWVTGQEVIYRANTTDEIEEIDGLIDLATYYVIVVDENRIKLAGDLGDLAAGNEVDIESVGIGLNHELDFYHQEEFTLEPQQVDISANTLSLPEQSVDTSANTLSRFYNGQLVHYSKAGNSSPIGGLEDDKYYFVIVKDDSTIQLASSRQNVDDQVQIDLTDSGTGTGHQLTAIQNTTRFNARTAVNSEKNSFTINGHGFQTGDTVVYNTDATFNAEAFAHINRTFDPNGKINIANNTISIAAQTLETGDKVVYQSGYVLDVGSAQNQAIGGLTSNKSYYLIKVDDNTIKLAASEADALAGQAIDLTSVGSGSLHTLFSEGAEAILVDDREIYGLENTATYYVSVIDQNTFRLTETREAAFDAEFVDLNSTDFGEGHRLQRADRDSPPGISIDANLKARDRSNGGGAARSTPKLRHFIKNPDLIANAVAGGGYRLLDQSRSGDLLKGKTPKGENERESPFKEPKGKNRFSVGLGVALNLVDHDVLAEVGSEENPTVDTVLKSDANISVNAKIEQKVQTRASGGTGKSEAGLALGLAIGVSDYDNSAQAIIQGNARLDAKEAIDVTSKVEYPFLFDVDDLASLDDTEEGDLTSAFDENDQVNNSLKLAELIGIDVLFGGNLLISKFTNTFAATKNTGKIDKGQIKGASYGFNGTIVVNDYDNVSEAIIRGGAQINQNTDYQTDQQSVNVKADTDIVLVGLVGMFHLDAALDVLATKTFNTPLNAKKENNLQSAFNPWGNTSQNGVGASVFAELLNNTTTAKIERGSKVHTGAHGDGLKVKAKEKVIVVGLTQSGAQVEGFGLAGSGSGYAHNSRTIAQIESGVTLGIRDGEGGPLTVNAHSDAVRVNAALTLVKSKNIGVGIGVAIDDSDRQVRAIIGDDKDDAEAIAARQSETDPTQKPRTSINVSGDIDVSAKVTGAVVSTALGINWAQAVSSGSPSSQSSGSGSSSGSSLINEPSPTATTFGHDLSFPSLPESGSSFQPYSSSSNPSPSSSGTQSPTKKPFGKLSKLENDVGDKFLKHLKKLTYERRSFALGITGGVAGNIQTESAKAYIYDYHGDGLVTAREGGDVRVNSENQTLTLSIAGLLTAAGTKQENKPTKVPSSRLWIDTDGSSSSDDQSIVSASLGAVKR